MRVGGLSLLLRVLEFGEDLPLVSSGIVVIGVLLRFFLGALLAGAAAEHGLVLVKVVMFVLVEVRLGHGDGRRDPHLEMQSVAVRARV